MVPQQPVVEWYLDRALQQVERTHFTIVTCRSVLEGHISPSSLVALFLSTLHYSEHSNHPFCSFSAFFFRNKTLLHIHTRCQWNKLLWPGYFLPAFSFCLLWRLLEVFFIRITLTASPLGTPRISQTQWFRLPKGWQGCTACLNSLATFSVQVSWE